MDVIANKDKYILLSFQYGLGNLNFYVRISVAGLTLIADQEKKATIERNYIATS
jgi:hypothetical protein